MNVNELIKELKTIKNKDKEIVTYITVANHKQYSMVKNDLICAIEHPNEVTMSFMQSKCR